MGNDRRSLLDERPEMSILMDAGVNKMMHFKKNLVTIYTSSVWKLKHTHVAFLRGREPPV